MRGIKFRAWEKNLKEMIPVDNIDFEKRMINTKSAWRLFNEIELMQYTGLKDKNGKEIYEGDIARKRNIIGGVVWANEYQSLGFYLKSKEGLHDVIAPYYMWDFEIIGNIYENPELLEESK